jgi:ribonuclease P protein component
LKKRADFLRIRGGRRVATRLFLLETKASTYRKAGDPIDTPRFGLTITNKIGPAVVRNKIRRRLKSILAEIGSERARTDHDYVIVARDAIRDATFAELQDALVKALSSVHAAPSNDGRVTPKRRT